MGSRRTLNQRSKWEQRKEKRDSKLGMLTQELTELHAIVPMAKWQRGRIEEIRSAYEYKQDNLNRAHDLASSRLAEDYAEFERDFILASKKFREDNPGQDWHPKGIRGVFTQAFWINIGRRAKRLGIAFDNHGNTKEA